MFHLQVTLETLSEEKIHNLREAFKIIDSEKSGRVTYKELKSVLERFDTNLDNSDISGLMQTPVSNTMVSIYRFTAQEIFMSLHH